MFTSKRGLFSSEHGATTSWLAGITSAALLVASIALPAVALDETATPEPTVAAEEVAAADEATAEETPAQETPAEEAAPAEEAVVDEPPAEEAAAEEAVIDVPLEDEVVDELAPAAADEPAPPAEDAASEEPAPVEEKATASSTDGDTPDINSPPVEEFVPGIKVTTDGDSATIAWPDFGLDENYTIQQEKKDGTWKTLDAIVEPSDTRDNEATIDGLKEGKEYTLRIVTANTEALAESATEDAAETSIAGPGLGSLVRAAVNGSPDVVVSNTFVVLLAAPIDALGESLPNDYQLTNWATTGNNPGWVTGTLGSENSNYAEGEVVPYRLEMGTLDDTKNYLAPVCRDFNQSSNTLAYGYTTLEPYKTSWGPGGRISNEPTAGGSPTQDFGAFTGVDINIIDVDETGASVGSMDGKAFACPDTALLTIVKFGVTGADAYLLWGGRLAAPGDENPTVAFGFSASYWTGGSLQMRMADANKTGGIKPANIIPLLPVLKYNDVNGDGSYDPVNELGLIDWTIFIDLDSDGVLDPGEDSVVTEADGYGFIAMEPGTTYTLCEVLKAGWLNTDPGSTCQTVKADVDKVVKFGNTNLGSITIVKDAQPNSAQDFAFTTTGAGLDDFSLDDDADGTLPSSVTFSGLLPGSRTVTESAVNGWNLTNLVCIGGSGTSTNLGSRLATINLAAGEDVTCTFTNTKLGKLTVVKSADPKDGTDFSFTGTGAGIDPSFKLDDDSDDTLSNTVVFSGLLPGTRTITETGLAGWNLTGLKCVNASDSSTDLAKGLATVNLKAGEDVTCTFTNTKLGKLTVVKSADPKDGTDFSFTGTGAGIDPSFKLDDDSDDTLSNTVVFSGLLPGTRTITETGLAGWNLTGLKCVNASDSSTDLAKGLATVNLKAGEDVTCTFTNTKLGKLTVVKSADPKDGTDFSFTGTGAGIDPSFKLDDDSDDTLSNTVVFSGLLPGTRTITETGLAGWNLTGLKCVNASDSSTDLAKGLATVNLKAGEDVTCTFTNTKLGKLTVVKSADPKDGTDFSFTGTGAGIDPSFKLDDDSDDTLSNTVVFSGLLPGTRTITETGLAGWNLTGLKCVNASDSSTDLAKGLATVNLKAGEDVTCTFTNTKLGKLTVVKSADPKDGTDFSFTGTGAGIDPSFKLDDDSDDTLSNTVVFSGLLPGTRTITETGLAGWNLTGLKCVNASDSSTDLAKGLATVNLKAGEDVTCTFTNTKLGKLTVVKSADPKDGTDFSFTGTGAGIDPSFKLDDDSDDTLSNTVVFSGLLPGTRTITETGLAGWNLTGLKCVNASDSSTDLAKGLATVNLKAGEDVTCTFTNTKLGKLTVVKSADPKDGTDFSFTGTGAGIDPSFKLDDDSDDTLSNTVVFSGLLPGTRTITETGLAGWNLTGLKCVNASDSSTDLAKGLATVNLKAGEDVTCTFTNTKLGKLTVVKSADPKDGTDFSFTGTGAGIDPSFKLDDDSDDTLSNTVVFSGLLPGTRTITETGLAGWNLTGLKCVNASDSSTDLAKGLATVNLKAGEEVTCTFTNVQTRYRLTVSPDAENLVDTDHKFTVTVETNRGAGWDPVVGVNPKIDVTGVGAVITDGDTCTDKGTDAAGQCTVTITSGDTGQTTVTATYAGTPGASTANLTDEGVKTWIDYRVNVTPPTAENLVNTDHVFTVTVETNSGEGWDPVVGVNPAIDVTGVGAVIADGDTCTDEGTDDDGKCTVTIRSDATGQTTVKATYVGKAASSDATRDYVDEGVKTWIDYRINVTPPTAENLVNTDHVFTVTVETNSGEGWDPVVGVNPAIDVTGVGAVIADGDTCTDEGTDDDGKCTVTIRSDATGQTTVKATYVGKAASSDATRDYVDEGVKTWIDYRINVTPPTAENLVNTDHVFTVTVETNSGEGWDPVVGVNPAIDVTGVGAVIADGDTCTDEGTDDDGKCTVTIRSDATGQTTVKATYVGKAASSDATRNYVDEGVKTWIDYRINVTPPTAENLVNTDHVFTVTVETNSGEGWDPVVGVNPAIDVTGVGAVIADGDTCTDEGTDDDGKCTVTIRSDATGQTTVKATYVGKAASSDATRNYVDEGVKTWIDYMVNVTPEAATNSIKDPHDFTVTVKKDAGDGEGFLALEGADVDISVSGSTGAITAIVAGSVDTPTSGTCTTDVDGQCVVTVNSATDGSLTVTATFEGTAADSASREYSDSGIKTWTSGSIEVLKVDDTETPMGNVTFELFSDANNNGVVDAGESLGQKTTLADGSATWTDLVWADDYKVVEVSWPTGYVPSGPVVTGPYTIDAENLLVTVNRVNNRIDIPKLDKFSVPAEGTAVQAGNTIAYTIEVKNDGALPSTGQTLLDTLPTGVALDVASVNPAGDTSVAGQITWKFDLGAYSAKTFTYTVTVTAGFGSPNLVNTATWVERKLTDKTEHPVVWPIMSLDKSADPAEGTDVSPLDTITYSVLVSNTGAGSFTGPMVDTLPIGFTADADSVKASGGVLSTDGRSITWTVTLAANSSATFTYSGTVDLTATADLVNTVVLTTPTGPISDSTIHPIAPVAPIEDVVEPEEEVVAGTEDLAKTGADYIAPLVTAALLALLAGGLMVVFGRRRRYNA